MALKSCPVCGSPINDTTKRCSGCGLSMEWIKRMQLDKPLSKRHIKCIVCGNDFGLSDYCCPKCGHTAFYLSPDLDLQESIDACRKDLESKKATEQKIEDNAGIDVDEMMVQENVSNGHSQISNQPISPSHQKRKQDSAFQKEKASVNKSELHPQLLVVAVMIIIALIFVGGSIARQKMHDKTGFAKMVKQEQLDLQKALKKAAKSALKNSREIERDYFYDEFDLFSYYDASSGEFVRDDDYCCEIEIAYKYDFYDKYASTDYYINSIEMNMKERSGNVSVAESTILKQAARSIIKKYELVFDTNIGGVEHWKNGQIRLDIYPYFLLFTFYYNSKYDGVSQVDILGMEINEDNIDKAIDKIHSLGFTDYRRAEFSN